VADGVVPDRAKVVVLVAHPDDETLWAGGMLLMHRAWTTFIATLCRSSDDDRAPKFFRALELLGAQGAMADLDDGPAQAPLGAEEVRATLRSLLPSGWIDLLVTHGLRGEYTRHVRHEEVSRSVLEMWARGEIVSRELWLFAYADGGGSHLPEVEKGAHLLVELSEDVWKRKQGLLTETYGFSRESWEARVAPRREAFWRLASAGDAWAWLRRGGPHG
jgi:LmbE family N-acetylglucosaminyl deacetylase